MELIWIAERIKEVFKPIRDGWNDYMVTFSIYEKSTGNVLRFPIADIAWEVFSPEWYRTLQELILSWHFACSDLYSEAKRLDNEQR